ncbi:hypothetical protein [Lysobacter enzymogenes]|uniref:hypothetical protein n=1 Tax=Lysobacter enzymogenes TaxID=69 RepID=UPI0009CB7BD5|nr:hypothetical protein [Lysobacter enzymogenes]UZW62543.1 hypothetical protein BV903_009745 [Lysobacter enzymogenes]
MSHPFSLPALAGALCLALPLAAFASPPPNANQTVPVCGYVMEMNLGFVATGTTARVLAQANLRPDGFSPPAPPPVSYTVYAAGWWRDDTHPNWEIDEDSRSGSQSFPAEPAVAGQHVFLSGGCQLKGVATVVVNCPSGPPQVRTLERTWVGCGL